MGFSVTRTDFIYNNNVNLGGSTPTITYDECLFLNLVEDFIHNGFTLYDSEVVDQNGNTSRPPTLADVQSSTAITDLQLGTVAVILVPDKTVDPLIDTNPWFLKISLVDNSKSKTYRYTGISIGASYYTTAVEEPRIGSTTEGIVQLYNILPAINTDGATPMMYPSSPYSYTLTIVERGFALNIASQTQPEDLTQSGFFVIQRAVSCGGAVTTTGTTPLYLLTNITLVPLTSIITSTNVDSNLGPQATWFALILREAGVLTPAPNWNDSVSIGGYTTTSYGTNGQEYLLKNTNISDTREQTGHVLHRFPDRWQAPVTRDTGEYVLLIPFGICSNRFAYTDELDLIAVSKANAYQASQSVPVTVYGQDRTYMAGTSNNTQVGNDSGVRVFLYTKGDEITATTVYTDVNIQATDTVTTTWGNVQANTGS